MNNKMFYPGEFARLQTLNLIPVNEDTRLKSLKQYKILDTTEELAYNELVELAAYVCKTPMAAISLIDHDRQWLKSRIGLNFNQAPRGHSFCAYAIMNPKQVMTISDAKTDPRFADHQLINSEPHARFYAGVPLNTLTGETLGTLCVLDQQPKPHWEKRHEELLTALSHQVMAQMELRKLLSMQEQNRTELANSRTQLQSCQKELRHAQAELKILSTTDPLTGVKNRHAFDQRLRQEYRRASRYRTPLSLILINIDRLTAFNDEHSKPEGDKTLKRVAHIVQAIVRNCDVVSRYNGDEFSVILPETNREGAKHIADRLRQSVENTVWPLQPVTISIGISTASTEYDHVMLIQQAAKALYRAKQEGRNRVVHSADIEF